METCARCKQKGPDRRTLMMACREPLGHLDVPFETRSIVDQSSDRSIRFHTLRVCEECEDKWMTAIETWFQFTDPSKMLPVTLADPQLGSYVDTDSDSYLDHPIQITCSCGYSAGPLHVQLHVEANPGHRILK